MVSGHVSKVNAESSISNLEVAPGLFRNKPNFTTAAFPFEGCRYSSFYIFALMRLTVASIDPCGSLVGKYTSSSNCKTHSEEYMSIVSQCKYQPNIHIIVTPIIYEFFPCFAKYNLKKKKKKLKFFLIFKLRRLTCIGGRGPHQFPKLQPFSNTINFGQYISRVCIWNSEPKIVSNFHSHNTNFVSTPSLT